MSTSTWREACPTWAFALVVVVLAALAALLVAACNAPDPPLGLTVEVTTRDLATLTAIGNDVIIVDPEGDSFSTEELVYALKAIALDHKVYGSTALATGKGYTWALIVHVGPKEGLR